MCLSKLHFNLDYDKEEGTYVGKGFKVLYHYVSDKYKHLGVCGIYDFRYRFNKWMDRWPTPYQLVLEDNFDIKYTTGFHIFLNKDDCENYRPRHAIKNAVAEYRLHPVLYKGILSFGEQELFNKPGFFSKNTYRTGPCIIADKMKILDSIPFSWEKNV